MPSFRNVYTLYGAPSIKKVKKTTEVLFWGGIIGSTYTTTTTQHTTQETAKRSSAVLSAMLRFTIAETNFSCQSALRLRIISPIFTLLASPIDGERYKKPGTEWEFLAQIQGKIGNLVRSDNFRLNVRTVFVPSIARPKTPCDTEKNENLVWLIKCTKKPWYFWRFPKKKYFSLLKSFPPKSNLNKIIF